MTLPILISGAGLSSLLLGQSLLRSKIPFLIFERDASLSFRGQGYRLRLSNEGLDAIEEVLGPKDFQDFYDICGKTGGSGFTFLDAITGKQLEVTGGPPGPPGPSPSYSPPTTEQKQQGSSEPKNSIRENLNSRDNKIVGISRGDMRNFFLKGIEDKVQWNKNVVKYELTSNGVRAIFGDGTQSVEGSMLIGGDGIKSRISKQVSNGKLKIYDTLARGIHGQAPTTAFKGLGEGVYRIGQEFDNPNLNPSQGQGEGEGEGGKKGGLFIITNVRSKDMEDPNINFGWTMIGSPNVIQIPNNDYSIIGKQATDIARNLTLGWNEKFQPLFREMLEDETAFWKVTCSSPSGVPKWDNQPRVTLIGDSVHSMTPAGGIGANTALRDSALLGRLLGESNGYKDGLTLDYEEKMRVYASEAVAQSYGQASKQFGVVIDEDTSPLI